MGGLIQEGMATKTIETYMLFHSDELQGPRSYPTVNKEVLAVVSASQKLQKYLLYTALLSNE
jgi:hypothetical protein